MSTRKPAVLLIDPVKTGEGYKNAARDLGLHVVSLYTMEPGELHRRWPEHAGDDDASLYAFEVADVLKELEAIDFEIKAVVPAYEPAVYLTDVLAHELGLAGNDVTLAWARRNKSAMREHAAASGLRIPAFRLVPDLSEVAAAAEEIGYPVIVKPTMSSGAFGVTLVRDAETAKGLSIEATDLFGWPVTEWLVEEYVRGREFAVNCYSSDGDHRVMDMWEYRQPDDRDYDFPLWDNVQATRDDRDWARVEAYVFEVLTAFGVGRGPSHTEVKVTAEGVCLIEIGARLAGGPAADQWTDHTAIRPFHDALTCYLGERPAIMDGDLGFRAMFGAIAIRNDEGPGTLVAIHGLDEMKRHPNVGKVLVDFQPGDRIPLTRNTRTIPVGAWVSGPDQDSVVRALREIRELVSLEIALDATD